MPRKRLQKNLLLVHNLGVVVVAAAAALHMLERLGRHILDSRYYYEQGQETDDSERPVVVAGIPDFAVAFVVVEVAAVAVVDVVVDILGSVDTLPVGSSCPAAEETSW